MADKKSNFSFDRVFFRRFGTLLKVLYPKLCSASFWLSVFVVLIGVLGKLKKHVKSCSEKLLVQT